MTDIMVPPYFLTEALSYLTLGGTGYLVWRFVRAYERRSVAAGRLRALAHRVRTLEAAVSGVEGEVRQVAEAQRFTTALLTTPAAARPSIPTADSLYGSRGGHVPSG